MKVVINSCFGGFSISATAVKELAKRKGKECYFFTQEIGTNKYTPVTVEEAEKAFMFFAYSVPNPEDFRMHERDEDGLFKSANERAEKISLRDSGMGRDDKNLISVVEILGEKANGRHAKLKVVEIPDGIKWEIDEYDGIEHIAEVHRTWS